MKLYSTISIGGTPVFEFGTKIFLSCFAVLFIYKTAASQSPYERFNVSVKPPNATEYSRTANFKFNATIQTEAVQSPSPSLINDGSDIRIFPSANPQSEVHLSIDQTNPNNIIASANTYTTTYQQGYYYSNNGGISWQGSDMLSGSSSVGGDPSTGYGSNGNAYISTMASTLDGYLLQYSTNKGVTWSSLNRGAGPVSGFDKEMITVDNTATSPYANNIYCAWTEFNNPTVVRFNRSTNGGTSFTSPITLKTAFGQGTNVQTGPNGEVYVCWADYGTGNVPANGIGFTRSLDGGVNFSTAVIAFAYSGIRTTTGPNPTFNNIRVNDFPSMAVDKSCGVHRGRIYIAYPTKENGNGKAIIQVRHSDDKGITWSTAVTVSIASGRQNWFPWICVDNLTGDVNVIYYSFDSASGFSTNTYVSNSSDGGATFANQKVSDVSHITAPINNSIFSTGYAGDYIGITAQGGRCYPAWMDNRNGTWQIYVSPLTFSNTPAISGDTLICNNVSETYTLQNQPPNTSVSWSVSPGGAATLTQNGNQATVTTTNDVSFSLTATVFSNCGSGETLIKKNIRSIGVTPVSAITISGDQFACVSYPSEYEVENFGNSLSSTYGVTKIVWTSVPVVTIAPNTGTCDLSSSRIDGGCVQITFPSQPYDYTVSLYAQAQNGCGLSAKTPAYQINVQHSCGPYIIYPNPATNTLYVSYNQKLDKGDKKDRSSYTVYIYDLNSNLKKVEQGSSNLLQFDISDIKTGQYILQIVDEYGKYSTHLQVLKN